MSSTPDFDIHTLVVMAHKATDQITSDRLVNKNGMPSWGSVKAASTVFRMIAEQLEMHAALLKDAGQHPKIEGSGT